MLGLLSARCPVPAVPVLLRAPTPRALCVAGGRVWLYFPPRVSEGAVPPSWACGPRPPDPLVLPICPAPVFFH